MNVHTTYIDIKNQNNNNWCTVKRGEGVQFDNNKYIRSKKQYNKRLFDLISSKVRNKAINKDRVRNEMEEKESENNSYYSYIYFTFLSFFPPWFLAFEFLIHFHISLSQQWTPTQITFDLIISIVFIP